VLDLAEFLRHGLLPELPQAERQECRIEQRQPGEDGRLREVRESGNERGATAVIRTGAPTRR
jgi:hypothetical protein